MACKQDVEPGEKHVCKTTYPTTPEQFIAPKAPVAICWRKGNTRIMCNAVRVVLHDNARHTIYAYYGIGENDSFEIKDDEATEFLRLFDAWVAWQEGKQ
jgi:hypothetical protein